jgi:hypothetical protein
MATNKIGELADDHPSNITSHFTETRISDMFKKKAENRF